QHNPTITKKGISYTIFMTSVKDGVNVYVNDSIVDPKSIKGKVTIPKEVTIKGKKYPVRVIGAPGLANCKNITEVVLPDTITTIGIGAFVNTGLKRITIPDSVKSIISESVGTYQKTEESDELTTVKGFVIYAKNNPVAEDYAYSMGIKYIDGKRAKAFKTTMKAKRAKGKKVRLTWTKNKYVTGYQIYKAAKKKGKYKRAATIKKPSTAKWTSKKMKKGKRVYFKMRTYTKIGNKTFYGKWSKVKSVKIK
ncbi:MAG: leucine-rich repeat protein, partial [Firmicutes bacterium]|nr:leucine-rich repeat protein [Bacillota bacterium]